MHIDLIFNFDQTEKKTPRFVFIVSSIADLFLNLAQTGKNTFFQFHKFSLESHLKLSYVTDDYVKTASVKIVSLLLVLLFCVYKGT